MTSVLFFLKSDCLLLKVKLKLYFHFRYVAWCLRRSSGQFCMIFVWNLVILLYCIVLLYCIRFYVSFLTSSCDLTFCLWEFSTESNLLFHFKHFLQKNPPSFLRLWVQNFFNMCGLWKINILTFFKKFLFILIFDARFNWNDYCKQENLLENSYNFISAICLIL